MFTIRFKCTHCKAELHSPESMVGRTLVCKKCGYMNIIPPSNWRKFFQFDERQGLTLKIAVSVVALSLFIAALCMAVSHMKSPEKALQEKYETLKTDNDALVTDFAKISEINDKLKTRVQQDMKEIKGLETELSRLHEQINNLQASQAKANEPPMRPVEMPDQIAMSPSHQPAFSPPSIPAPAPAPTTAISAVPALKKEMPNADQEKIRNMLSWLRSNRTCISCGGTGLIQGAGCSDCTSRTETKTLMLTHNKRGNRTPTDDYYVTGFKGNGLAKISHLRPSLDSILGLCQKYADCIPPELLSVAKGTCCDIDPGMASHFPSPVHVK